MNRKMHDDSCDLCGVARERALISAGRGADVVATIRGTGYHKVGVFSEVPGEPDYSYTVGMFHMFRHPEVVVFGLDIETEFAIIDTIADLVEAGTIFRDEETSLDILNGTAVTFRKFAKAGYGDYLVQATNFYKSDSYPVLVVTWPDRAGAFPWDKSSPEWLRARQPAVWED